MGKVIEILSPAGVRPAARRSLAKRLASLSGKVIGLMDNNKPGGRELLEGLREELEGLGISSFIYRRKAHPAAASPYVDEVASQADAVIGAIGD